jgi:hypothetical protein
MAVASTMDTAEGVETLRDALDEHDFSDDDRARLSEALDLAAEELRQRRRDNERTVGRLILHFPSRDVSLGPVDGHTALRVILAHKRGSWRGLEDRLRLASPADRPWMSLAVHDALAVSWWPDSAFAPADPMTVDPPAKAAA